MSVELDTPGFRVDVTLTGGEMAFGFNDPDEVRRFLDFVRDHPDHVFHGDGMRFPCSLLQERYLTPDNVRDPLGADDLNDALHRYGWL